VVAPSAIAVEAETRTSKGKQAHPVPHALTTDELPGILQEFVQGSLNAIEAGFDGVELHSANGYLLHEFLAPNSNVRSDSYGGSPENRARFVIETVNAVVAAVDVLVRNPATVHDLREDPAAFGMHCVRDRFPAGNLLGRDDAWLPRVGASCRARVRAFADDQAKRGALAVVLGNDGGGYPRFAGAETGQRGHHQAVGQFELAESQRGKQHAQFLSKRIGSTEPNCEAPATIPDETRITTDAR
jgi:hypothetical protein